MVNNTLGFARAPYRWLLVGAIAALMGLSILFATRLPLSRTIMWLAVVVAPFVLLVVKDIRRVGVALILLDIPLQIDTYIGFDEAQADFGATIGYLVSLTTLMLIVLYGHWVLNLLRDKMEGHQPSKDPLANSHKSITRLLVLLPLLYIVIGALTLIVAPDSARVTYEVWALAQSFLAFVYIVYRMRTREDVLFFITLLVIGLVIEGLIMMILRASGQSFSFGVINGKVESDWQGLRIGGTLSSPNTAAGYLGLMLAVSAGLLLARVSLWQKALSVFGLLVGSIGLILTLSRGGWITFSIVVVVLLSVGVYRRFLRPAVVVAVVMVVAGVVVAFRDDIVERLTGDDRGSAQSRVPLNDMAWRMIGDHPLLGVGLNNYDVAMQDYITPDLSGEWIFIVHNRYLSLWSETGIGGVLAFVGVILLGMVNGWHALRSKDPVLSPIALGLFAGCCGILFHLSVDVFNSRNITEMLWVVAAIQLVMARLCAQTTPKAVIQQEAYAIRPA